MNHKRLLVIVYAIFGLILSSVALEVGFNIMADSNQWYSLGIGVGFMVLGLVSYFVAKYIPFFYLVTFFFNMIGVGLSITAYYVLGAFPLNLSDYAMAITVSILVLIGYALISRFRWFKAHIKIYTSIVILITFILSLTLWVSIEGFTGLSFYYLNIIFFFMIGILSISDSLEDLAKELSIISFGAFILVSIIVLIILSEGEAINGLDIPLGNGKKTKKTTFYD